MNTITKDIDKLSQNDALNILLYSIYKLNDDPQYAAISELIYALDSEGLFRLCSIYGGVTIKIPTLHEIENATKVLLIAKLIQDGLSFEEAITEAGIDPKDIDYVGRMYNQVARAINEYDS